ALSPRLRGVYPSIGMLAEDKSRAESPGAPGSPLPAVVPTPPMETDLSGTGTPSRAIMPSFAPSCAGVDGRNDHFGHLVAVATDILTQVCPFPAGLSKVHRGAMG